MAEVAGAPRPGEGGTPGGVPASGGPLDELPRRERSVPPSRRPALSRFGKPVVFLLSLLPVGLILWRFLHDQYGEPVRDIEHATGEWALRFLAITLALTPLRRLFGWNVLAKYRRMLGLFTFFYATVHLGIYLGLDMLFDASDIVEDATKHPRIWIGLAAWGMLVPLAITSTKGWIRRLGGKRWNRLHQLIYVIAVLATIHYLLAVKLDTLGPYTFGVIFAVLLGLRGWWALRKG